MISIILLSTILSAQTLEAQEYSKQDRIDFAITMESLSFSTIDTGTTWACKAARKCKELNPIMNKWIGDSLTKALIIRTSIQGVAHYLIWKFIPRGKVRTISLSILAGTNTFNGIHNIRVLRKTLD